ncbi:hypothetical protein F9U64_11035 [Gracilibacillus oryzae]|uniref:Uncharacterized protein n=1 Tax=Gracilibacillus oryzae TaxID=1672701 RepID=A0A7C8KV43_9BACI|nr:hypothetical protein [Gracilibacillus oryzae]KAB8135795.1 hypothetical protein F9U64_11035 [Gracilibacillus oryzae]
MDQQIEQMQQSIEEIRSEIQLIRDTVNALDTKEIISKLEPFLTQIDEEFNTIKKEMQTQNQAIHQLKQQSSSHSRQYVPKRPNYTIPGQNTTKLF